MLSRIQQRGKHKGRVTGEAVENESLQELREEKAQHLSGSGPASDGNSECREAGSHGPAV